VSDLFAATETLGAGVVFAAGDLLQLVDIQALDRNLPTHLLSVIVSPPNVPDPKWTKVLDS
jgi:hypothetical protein